MLLIFSVLFALVSIISIVFMCKNANFDLMRTINNFLQAALQINLPVLAVDAMLAKKQDYIDHQQDQMFEGIKSDGKSITPPYAPLTILIKESKGDPYDRVTLKDTGNFYNAIFIDKRSDGFLIDSKDSKANELQEKYSDEIFGLADLRKQDYTDIVKPVFVQSVVDGLNKV